MFQQHTVIISMVEMNGESPCKSERARPRVKNGEKKATQHEMGKNGNGSETVRMHASGVDNGFLSN